MSCTSGHERLSWTLGLGSLAAAELLLLERVAAPAVEQISAHTGYDNSAPQQKGLVLWDKDPKYPAQTVAVVASMAKNFSAYPALLGFNLLDSPVVRSFT